MQTKITTEDFINRAQGVHGDNYDYSLVEYVDMTKKVKIICKKHGIFEQGPHNHLKGCGCGVCGLDRKILLFSSNTNDFIKKAKETHGSIYDYSLVSYVNSIKKVKIICKTHGIFEQTPNNHLNGSICLKCSNEKKGKNKRLDNNKFIERAKSVHGDKYEYSLAEYITSHKMIKIICSIHGIFKIRPTNHLNGQGCMKCGVNSRSVLKTSNTDEYIKKVKAIHGDKYDYSLVNYIKAEDKIKIVCEKHGVFEQRTYTHLSGGGCVKCYHDSKLLTQNEYIERCKLIHDGKYDYSLVSYLGGDKKIKIICPVHGVFEQKATIHIFGGGCKMCFESRGEIKILKFLTINNVFNIREKRFEYCKNLNTLPFDFYLPNHNMLIEFDGQQHFEPIKYFGGEKRYQQLKINDEIKNTFAKESNIKLIRIKYNQINNIDSILNKELNIT